MTGVTDLTGRTTRYEYDKDGNLTRVIREDGETRIAYDKLGQITGLVNQYEGKTISAYGYAYDERGNITNEKIRLFQDGLTVEQEYIYQYDGMSQLIRSELTQLVGITDGKKEHQTVTVTYAYDPAGNRLMMQTEADGATQKTTYTYDEAGRLTTAEDSLTGQTRYTYDAAGNLIKEEGSRTRYYLYDASNRLSAVTDQENLLLAALYDGSDNRVFMMEYMPELIQKETDDTQNSPDADAPTAAGQDTLQAEQGSTGKNNAEEKELQTLTGSYDQRENSLTQNNVTQNSPPGEAPLSEDQTGSNGFTAFWYGVLCQAADILLPSPTPFKTWLHNKMNFTDDITVLWEEEIYETDFSAAAETVQKEGTPFDLISRAVADTTGQQLAADAYRQVSYVNDTTGVNARVLAENITNGGMGDAAVNYTYGIYRESYTLTGCAPSAGNTPFAGISPATGDSAAAMTVRGTYYYTGTGSVANLISGSKKTAYTYTPGGTGTTYTTDSYKVTIRTTDGTTGIRQTYENYAYNGEYTHETLGIQYLRARYYNMTTGTFTSKDTYAGRIESILSQNRYTYAENNPVNFADPSGHAKTKNRLPSLQDNIRVAKGGNGPALKPTVNNPTDAAKAAYQSRRDAAGLPKENTLLDNVRIYNGQEYYNGLVLRTPVSALMSPVGGSLTFAESIAAKVEAARCMAYDRCENAVQESIKLETLPVYALAADDFTRLSPEQQLANATYIYYYLLNEGWSTEAICGLLGNIHEESHYNPGTWEVMNESGTGYGLVQWTDAKTKFLNWLSNKLGMDYVDEKMEDLVNEMANNSPEELMNYELNYLLESCQPGEGEWIPTTEHNTPERMGYQTYITTTVGTGDNVEEEIRRLALIFHGSYERSADDQQGLEERAEGANRWYDYFQNHDAGSILEYLGR